MTLLFLISDASSQQRNNYLIRIFFCLSYWLKTPGYFFKTSHRLSNLEYFCWDHVMFTSNCPRGDFAQKAKSGGGTLITRAYIKGSTYSWNIQWLCHKKSRFAWTGAARNRWVMIMFLLFAPASTKWLGWRKDRKSRRDRLGRSKFCGIYCAVILGYSFGLRVISDILWSSCFESYGPRDTR